VIKQSGISRAPDIRSRAIIRDWCCQVKIAFVKPIIRLDFVVKLLATAGYMGGVGDWRAERGSGSFGLFELVEPTDPRYLAIQKTGARAAQLAALESPTFYDADSEDLYTWYLSELERRSFNNITEKKVKKGNGATVQL
jgi:hypothetical protein